MKNKTKSIKKEWKEIAELIQTGLGLEDDERIVLLNILNEFASPKLVLAKKEAVKECLEEAKDIVKVGIQHGILPIPNPYGDMVRIKRHNQVMVECKDIAISILDQALSIVNNKK